MRIGVIGGTGKLGQLVLRRIIETSVFEVGAVITHSNNKYLHQDVGIMLGIGTLKVYVTDNMIKADENCDVFVDLSNVDAFRRNLADFRCVKKPIIFATTGFSNDDMNHIHELSESVPILVSANFSSKLIKFMKVVELAAKEFGMEMDVDIIESHHKSKKDKPSGTATMIEELITDTLMDKKKINIHSIRAGNIIGEHTVAFVSDDDERIELSHKIFNRNAFVTGIIDAVHWIGDKPAGLYDFKDLMHEDSMR